MADPVTIVLGGICVAVVSGTVGKYIGGDGKVTELHCNEKQSSCQSLILEKISNLDDRLEALTKAVNNKILGI